MVERLVANEKVEGSTPFARSNLESMNDLLKKRCIPCEGGVLPFDTSEIHKYQKKIDGWNIVKNEKEIFVRSLFSNCACVRATSTRGK